MESRTAAKEPTRRTIGQQVSTLLVIILLLIWGGIGYEIWSGRGNALSQAETVSFNLARSLAAHAAASFDAIDARLRAIESDLTSAAPLPPLSPGGTELLARHIAPSAALYSANTFGPDGLMLQSAIRDKKGGFRRPPRAISIADRAYFKQLAQPRTWSNAPHHIGRPVQGRITGEWILPVARARQDAEGRFQGIVLATINLETFWQQFLEGFDIAPSSSIALLHRKGYFLARAPFNPLFFSKEFANNVFFRDVLPNRMGGLFVDENSIDKRNRMIAFQNLEKLPLAASVTQTVDDILARWLRTSILLFVIGLTTTGALIHFARSIMRQAAELARQHDNLEVMVADRTEALTRANQDLQRHAQAAEEAHHRAERANRAKSEFLAHMSHEIRTPLTSLIGMGDLLKEAALSPEQKQYLQILNRSGTTLMAIINDVLDLSKIEAGELVMDNAPFDPRELLDGVIEAFLIRARDKGIALEGRIDNQVPGLVTGDGQRLRQILFNLVGNAVKFTREGGTISVRIAAEKTDELLFEVSDDGIGIAPEKVEAIFDPFTQEDVSTTRRFGGTGLGLTICRRLLDLMDGVISVESRLGEGSRFWLTVPLPAASASEASPHEHLSRNRNRTDAADDDARPLTILLADDAKENRMVVRAYLRGAERDIVEAEDGAEAFEAFQKGRFDVVLMDIQMPNMDGYAATREIRAWEASQGRPRTPIIALTAYAMKEDREKAMTAGCDLHLGKPIRKAPLLSAIAQLVA